MSKQKRKKDKTLTVEVGAPQNFVAKHMNTFNRATVETDRKKQAKKNGHTNMKHKGRLLDY